MATFCSAKSSWPRYTASNPGWRRRVEFFRRKRKSVAPSPAAGLSRRRRGSPMDKGDQAGQGNLPLPRPVARKNYAPIRALPPKGSSKSKRRGSPRPSFETQPPTMASLSKRPPANCPRRRLGFAPTTKNASQVANACGGALGELRMARSLPLRPMAEALEFSPRVGSPGGGPIAGSGARAQHRGVAR